MRWAFVRKVYLIMAIMVVMTSIVVFIPPVANFFVSTTIGGPEIVMLILICIAGLSCAPDYWYRYQSFISLILGVLTVALRLSNYYFASSGGVGLYVFLLVLPIIVLCFICCNYQYHPVNLWLLGFFTLTMSLVVGLICAFTEGEIILKSAIFTSVVVTCLTMYTFWAAKRGHDFIFLQPVLYFPVMIILALTVMQFYISIGRMSLTLYGGFACLIFCGYVVLNTDNLIKRYSYNDYVWASVVMYIDLINLFLFILTLFQALDS